MEVSVVKVVIVDNEGRHEIVQPGRVAPPTNKLAVKCAGTLGILIFFSNSKPSVQPEFLKSNFGEMQ